MAPVDPDAVGHSNTLPLAIFSGQVLLIVGITGNILRTIYRSARSLPPATATRAQQSARLRNAAIFSTLGFLSLASVSTFAVAWRVLSYFEWAQKGSHEIPGTIWSGYYGTGEEGVGRWRLGDWWADIDRIDESAAKVLAAPESFLYLYQHFCGVTATAIFFGVEGRRRNFSKKTIASFVAVSAFGSLGLALNLFFVTMLFTPMALHDDDSLRHDALFSPKPSVLYIPVIGSILLEQALPMLLATRRDLTGFRIAYLGVPVFLAFAPEIVPKRWGRRHSSKAAAHHSYVRAFYYLGVTSLVLYWKQVMTSLLVNTPPAPNAVESAYDFFRKAVGRDPDRPNRLVTGISDTFQHLKHVSKHPAISVTGSDVAFTLISLLAWAFVRQLDVNDILDNSVLSFLRADDSEQSTGDSKFQKAFSKVKKSVSPAPKHEQEEESIPPVTPRRRGRPKKSEIAAPSAAAHTATSATASGTGSLRRSTRRRTGAANSISEKSNPFSESEDADSAYEPSRRDRSVLEQMETDRSPVTEDLLAGGETTALGLVLGFFGGLGQVAAGVLGAEVTGDV